MFSIKVPIGQESQYTAPQDELSAVGQVLR